jgi:hypothetical protein
MNSTRWKAPSYAQLDVFEKELGPLYKQSEALQKKILSLCEKRDAIVEEIDRVAVDRLPKAPGMIGIDPDKLTKAQWAWLLQAGHRVSSCRYTHRTQVLEGLGLSGMGFYETTEQPCITIHHYGFNKDRALRSIKLLVTHLKADKVVDPRHGPEQGIRILLTGLESSTTSVFYIHEDKTVTLYVDRYSNPRKFKSIKELLDWYETAKKED